MLELMFGNWLKNRTEKHPSDQLSIVQSVCLLVWEITLVYESLLWIIRNVYTKADHFNNYN